MAKKTLADLPDVKGKRVLVRVDFNVPQDAAGNITNDRRIRAALPTLKALLDRGASLVVMSHLGRPTGDAVKDAPFKMDKVAARLGELLGKPVRKVDEVVGAKATAAAQALKPGEVLVLENLRFHPGEQEKDKAKRAALAAEIAALGDAYVNDAFGTCHRADASMAYVPAAMKGKPRVVGLLVQKELEILDKLLSSPARPLLGILGGGKVSDKILFIKALLQKTDRVLIGGAMSYTLMKAAGRAIGKSRCEEDRLAEAREILALGGSKIQLPIDHLVVEALDKPATAKIVEGDIPDGLIGVDIGPKTIALYQAEILKAGTVLWNGPLGKFEDEPYSKGTRAIGQTMASAGGKIITVVGGGETAEAAEEYGLAEKMTHVSTGGGAFLEYVQGSAFPALAEVEEK
jgi:phosphoglycerate kinase